MLNFLYEPEDSCENMLVKPIYHQDQGRKSLDACLLKK